MLQILPIALTQVKGNTSENLLNEISQLIYTLYQEQEDNIKNLGKYKNNKFKISAPTWNEEFELPYRSYSVSHIQDYFEYILRKT